jgi:hypothetical protein
LPANVRRGEVRLDSIKEEAGLEIMVPVLAEWSTASFEARTP